MPALDSYHRKRLIKTPHAVFFFSCPKLYRKQKITCRINIDDEDED